MKKSPFNLLKASIIVYSLLLTFCSTDKSPLTDDEIHHYLADKYDAVILTDIPLTGENKSIASLLETTTVLDTVVFSAGIDVHGHFLKALVQNKELKKCYAQFYCSKTIYDDYINSKTTSFIIAAKLSKITYNDALVEAESIEGQTLFFSSNKEIFFSGECIELIENEDSLLNKNVFFNQS